MLATFGIAQPIFLAVLLFTMQLRLTDLVGRYHQDAPLGYRMVAESELAASSVVECGPEPRLPLEGVRRQVTRTIAIRSAACVMVPMLVQAGAVPLMMWVADHRLSAVEQLEANGTVLAHPIPCFQTWYEFFFMDCGQFQAEDGAQLPVCRFSLLSTLGYEGSAVIFLIVFSHACISAKRQMVNKRMRRRFRCFQVLLTLATVGAAVLRALVFALAYEELSAPWVPDLLTICANTCEALLLLLALLTVLRG